MFQPLAVALAGALIDRVAGKKLYPGFSHIRKNANRLGLEGSATVEMEISVGMIPKRDAGIGPTRLWEIAEQLNKDPQH